MNYTITPIGYVRNSRKEIKDDYWGDVVSIIELAEGFDGEVLAGISDFSHLYVIFYFDKVLDETIDYEAKHPRNNEAYPKVGIFAQRKKNRPNKLGLTAVELLAYTGTTLTVKGLDAIDGTPIMDIKPVMKEFLPRGDIKQPAWSIDLMRRYWD